MRADDAPLSLFDPGSSTGLERGLFGDWGIAIRLRAGCSNRCLFCHGYRERASDTTPEEVLELLGRREPSPLFFFGEVLNHPRLLEILDAVRARGYERIELQGTGEELADRDLVRALEGRVRSVSFAIYGSGALHDRLVGRPGAYELIRSALENLRDHPRLKVYMHSVLMSVNVAEMAALRDLAASYGHPFALLPLDPKPEVPGIEKLLCSFSDLVRLHSGAGLNLVGFPLCVVRRVDPALYGRLANHAEPVPWRWEVPEGVSDVTFGYTRIFRYVQPDRCGTCAVRTRCPGVFKRHLERFGESELEPALPEGPPR